jgi:ureidoacrylate peracid hydrolase
MVLRGLAVTTVVITGVTTENCCHATARDAYFRDFKVVFSPTPRSRDYPDLGYGSMSADEVQRAVLVMLARDSVDVVTTDTFVTRVVTASGVSSARRP